MAQTYKWIILNKVVQRQSDGACIPNDSGNKDWKQFLEDVIGGATVTAADPPPTPAAILADEIASAIDTFLNSSAPQAKIMRAIVLVMLDQVNTCRAGLTTPLPPGTPAQLRTAIQNKLQSGAAN